MINLSQNGMRCRTTKEIRTHEGLIRRFTEGTIQGVIANFGRQLINVEWDSGIIVVTVHAVLELQFLLIDLIFPKAFTARSVEVTDIF